MRDEDWERWKRDGASPPRRYNDDRGRDYSNARGHRGSPSRDYRRSYGPPTDEYLLDRMERRDSRRAPRVFLPSDDEQMFEEPSPSPERKSRRRRASGSRSRSRSRSRHRESKSHRRDKKRSKRSPSSDSEEERSHKRSRKHKKEKKKKHKKRKHSKRSPSPSSASVSEAGDAGVEAELDTDTVRLGTRPAEDSDEGEVGPAPMPQVQNVSFGTHLRPGEGAAMAAFAAAGKRIPRRGEVGLTSDQIDAFEAAGYVMSGNRHKRMNAVRMRKEDQIHTAEEKTQLLKMHQEQRQIKENNVLSEFRQMVQSKFGEEVVAKEAASNSRKQ